jgi:hypothetical protein
VEPHRPLAESAWGSHLETKARMGFGLVCWSVLPSRTAVIILGPLLFEIAEAVVKPARLIELLAARRGSTCWGHRPQPRADVLPIFEPGPVACPTVPFSAGDCADWAHHRRAVPRRHPHVPINGFPRSSHRRGGGSSGQTDVSCSSRSLGYRESRETRTRTLMRWEACDGPSLLSTRRPMEPIPDHVVAFYDLMFNQCRPREERSTSAIGPNLWGQTTR